MGETGERNVLASIAVWLNASAQRLINGQCVPNTKTMPEPVGGGELYCARYGGQSLDVMMPCRVTERVGRAFGFVEPELRTVGLDHARLGK